MTAQELRGSQNHYTDIRDIHDFKEFLDANFHSKDQQQVVFQESILSQLTKKYPWRAENPEYLRFAGCVYLMAAVNCYQYLQGHSDFHLRAGIKRDKLDPRVFLAMSRILAATTINDIKEKFSYIDEVRQSGTVLTSEEYNNILFNPIKKNPYVPFSFDVLRTHTPARQRMGLPRYVPDFQFVTKVLDIPFTLHDIDTMTKENFETAVLPSVESAYDPIDMASVFSREEWPSMMSA